MKNTLSTLIGMKRVNANKVSKDTGISKNSIYALYHEQTKDPSFSTILKLCEYFEVTPNQFLGIDPINFKEE